MNFIDRINSWIVGRIRGSREIEFAGDVLSLGQKRLPLRTLTSAVGYQEDMYLGRRIALAMSFGDSSIVKISQDDPFWFEFVGALDRLGLTNAPSAEWMVRLVAGEDKIVLRGEK